MAEKLNRKEERKRERKKSLEIKRGRASKISKQSASKPKRKTAFTPKPQSARKASLTPQKPLKPKVVADLEKKIIDLFNVHTRLKPVQIAEILDLDFDRDSKDRLAITKILKHLTDTGLIVNNGGQFVQPYRAKPDEDKDIVGVVEKRPSGSIVRPANPDLKIMKLEVCDVADGTIVTVRPKGQDTDMAKIISDHGAFDEAEGLCKLTALDAGIPIEFSTEVLAEVANATVPSIGPDRKDMRNIPFITIDPDTAKDFDDAICVRKHGKNTRVMVAIADVGHYVSPGMHTYDEAMERGNSTYLPGLTIPMLPESLSNGLCSLQPNKDRAAYVMTIDIDPNGHMLKYDSTLALIRSRARLTYEQAQEAIEEKSIDPEVMELHNKYISKALAAYRLLLAEREERGALDLNVKEQRMDVTQHSGFHLKLENGNESHGLIEESMILANRAAIATLVDRKMNVVVRAHGGPNDKLLREKIPEFEKLGMIVDQDMSAEEMVHDIAKQAKGHKNGDKIRRTLIRVQSVAGYKAKESHHFALALDNYGHFTSPIRRAADLVVHHLLQGGQTKHPDNFSQEKLEALTEHWNKTEKRSENAERSVQGRLAAKWVQGNMKEKFNAQVVGIGDHEISVRVDYPSIVTDIAVPDTSKYRIRDSVEIQPVQANAVTGIIDFNIAKRCGAVGAQQEAEIENRRQKSRHPRTKANRAEYHAPIVARR